MIPKQQSKHRASWRHSRKRPVQSSSPITLSLALLALVFLFCLPLVMGNQNQEQVKGHIIGIDLGTTYSCVGVYRDGNVDIIANDQGNRITPSYVAFTSANERLVGDAAKNQATINPEKTIFDAKRLIGRKYSDKSVQADKKMMPFEIVSDGMDQPRIRIQQDGKGTNFAPEEISAMVLAKMKSTAEAYLGEDITRAVITVPAYFNQAQKEATRDAARIAGLTVERIINEPTAAAIAYGLDQGTDAQDQNVLVFDLGGGTFDVTLLNIDEGVFEVLSSEGDTHLGGEDFDQRVMQYLVKKIQKSTNGKIDISNDNRALQKLRKEVERVKRALSSQNQARVEIEDLVPGYDLQDTLTRARFEELNLDLFKQTLKPVESVLKVAGLDKSEVDHVVLVGGSTRIPKIQEMLSDFFDGKQLSKNINPDEAVAFGAAVQGGILAGRTVGQKEDIVVVVDKVTLSMGIETVGGVFTKIIPRGTHMPSKKSQTFSTHQDNQSRVMIDVYEGERAMTKDNHPLGKFELIGIPPAPRGVPQIEVTFKVDANGILEVSAEDKGTGKAERIIITAEKGRLSEEEIDRLVREAAEYAEEDLMVKERIDSRNGLESYIYTLKNSFEDKSVSYDVSSEDMKELLDLLDGTLDWMEANPEVSKEEYDTRKKDVEQIANPLMRHFYDRRGGGTEDDGEFSDADL
ncbi:chaperone protein DnaK [Nitzschia inconspicua]|uniref:Chaperone protein DnaK n=1 Tax=Nitzschia inconspicua TaxID=303405 RepID=A0A9K3PGC1_9STRA|nr:chaperone protein DnaK [Nitzschia inconspicua]